MIILSFARSYDPQRFHLDDAADSPFDGVVHQEIETGNQDDETVLWMEALVLYPRIEDEAGE